MKFLFMFALLLMLSPLSSSDNRRLMEENIRSLQELNRQILEQLQKFPQYRGKEIYLKVRIAEKSNGQQMAIIEKIAVDKIAVDPADDAAKVIYLKGKFSPGTSNDKFKLDLEHVLPEEDHPGTATTGKEEKTP